MHDRQPKYPGRVKLVPVDGQSNVYDMTMADEPVVEGDAPVTKNLLKQQTAALFGLGPDAVPDEVLSAIRGPGAVTAKYPVADGQTVKAGDVVDIVGGKLEARPRLIKDLSDDAILDSADIYTSVKFRVIEVNTSQTLFGYVVENSSSSHTLRLKLVNTSDLSVVATKDIDLRDKNSFDIVYLSPNNVAIVYLKPYRSYITRCTTNANTISLTPETEFISGDYIFISGVVGVDNTHFCCVQSEDAEDGGSRSVDYVTLSVNGNVTHHKKYVAEYGASQASQGFIYTSPSGKKYYVAIISGDYANIWSVNSYEITSSNTLTLKSSVSLNGETSVTGALYGSSFVVASYYKGSQYGRHTTIAADGTFSFSARAKIAADISTLTAVSPTRSIAYGKNPLGFRLIDYTSGSNTFSVVDTLDILSTRGIVTNYLLPTSNSTEFRHYYHELGQNVARQPLIIVGNELGSQIAWESKDAIALEAGSAKHLVEVIFSGSAYADWVTAGQQILSDGVKGTGILDGVLQVAGANSPGTKVVTGSYVGTGTYGEDNPVSITFPSAPRLVLVKHRDSASYLNSYSSSFLWLIGDTKIVGSSYFDNKVISSGPTFSWAGTGQQSGSSYDAGSVFNAKNAVYSYFAIL